jgi:hypothetical protein
MSEENKRTMSWNDAWDVINSTLEKMDNEHEMIPMLQGQLSYVLSCYIKRRYHDTMILDIIEELRESLAEDEEVISDECEEEQETAGNA